MSRRVSPWWIDLNWKPISNQNIKWLQNQNKWLVDDPKGGLLCHRVWMAHLLRPMSTGLRRSLPSLGWQPSVDSVFSKQPKYNSPQFTSMSPLPTLTHALRHSGTFECSFVFLKCAAAHCLWLTLRPRATPVNVSKRTFLVYSPEAKLFSPFSKLLGWTLLFCHALIILWHWVLTLLHYKYLGSAFISTSDGKFFED